MGETLTVLQQRRKGPLKKAIGQHGSRKQQDRTEEVAGQFGADVVLEFGFPASSVAIRPTTAARFHTDPPAAPRLRTLSPP